MELAELLTPQSQTIPISGNVPITVVLVLVIVLLIWGILDQKKHQFVLAITVLIIIALAFAIMFGKVVVTIVP